MNKPNLPTRLRFLHLSDLHIRAGAPDIDPNADVRRQLSADVVHLASEMAPFTGILFSGDVAHSGSTAEYLRATEWLAELTQILNLPPENVWIVPGNHDVDVTNASDGFLAIQHELRTSPQHQLSERLSAILNDPSRASHIFSRLRGYNDFALQYGCEVGATRPFWSQRWDLADGSAVVLRGVTSPLISAIGDSEGDNKLVVGEFQVHLNSPEPAIHIAMCHHPPSWLRDWEDVETYLDTRSSLQLFGHRHVPNAIIRDRSLRISAGAVHPERGHGWEPRYNFIEVAPGQQDERPVLQVTVRQRMWHRNEAVFGPVTNLNNEDEDQWVLPLNPHVFREVRGSDGEVLPTPINRPEETYAMGDTSNARKHDPITVANRGRRLAYELARLSTEGQGQIGITLGLIEQDERTLPARLLVPLLLGRASERGKLAALWAAIVGDEASATTTNPFDESHE